MEVVKKLEVDVPMGIWIELERIAAEEDNETVPSLCIRYLREKTMPKSALHPSMRRDSIRETFGGARRTSIQDLDDIYAEPYDALKPLACIKRAIELVSYELDVLALEKRKMLAEAELKAYAYAKHSTKAMSAEQRDKWFDERIGDCLEEDSCLKEDDISESTALEVVFTPVEKKENPVTVKSASNHEAKKVEVKTGTHKAPFSKMDIPLVYDQDILNIQVEDLYISVRAFNKLKANKINTLRDIFRYSHFEFLCIHGVGNSVLEEIISEFAKNGVFWQANKYTIPELIRHGIIDSGISDNIMNIAMLDLIPASYALKRRVVTKHNLFTVADVIKYTQEDMIKVLGISAEMVEYFRELLNSIGVVLPATNSSASNHEVEKVEVDKDSDKFPFTQMNPPVVYDQKLLNTDVEELDISTRAFNLLKQKNVNKLRDIFKYSHLDFLRTKGIGVETLKEIVLVFARKGVFWREKKQTVDELISFGVVNSNLTDKRMNINLSKLIPTEYDWGHRVLAHHNLVTVADLMKYTEDDMIQVLGLGAGMVTYFRELLSGIGLVLPMDYSKEFVADFSGLNADRAENLIKVLRASKPVSASNIESEEKWKAILATPIQNLNISIASFHSLRRMEVTCVGDILTHTHREFLKHRNVGYKALNRLLLCLEQLGVDWKATKN